MANSQRFLRQSLLERSSHKIGIVGKAFSLEQTGDTGGGEEIALARGRRAGDKLPRYIVNVAAEFISAKSGTSPEATDKCSAEVHPRQEKWATCNEAGLTRFTENK